MTHLPIDQKHLIQTSYVRFCELVREADAVNNQVTIGKYAHWGGLAVAALGIVRMIVGRGELPSWLGGLALLVFIFGWAYESDQRKKQEVLSQERDEIEKKMEELGISFYDSSGRVQVYYGPISQGNIFEPLADGSYR